MWAQQASADVPDSGRSQHDRNRDAHDKFMADVVVKQGAKTRLISPTATIKT